MKHLSWTEPRTDFFKLTVINAARLYEALVYCKSCGHRTQLDLFYLARQYGRDAPTAKLKGRLTCSYCGTRGPIIIALPADTTTPGKLLNHLQRGPWYRERSGRRAATTKR